MTITQFIASLTFPQFVELFGTMWNKETGRFEKWVLWDGVLRDGVQYAGQREMLHDFETQEISWLAKARQLAGSEGAALYAIYICLKYPNSLVTVFSKDFPAAAAFLEERVKMKIDGMLKMNDPDGKPWPFSDAAGGMPWRTKTDGSCVIDGAVSFYNGSSIEAFSSENTGPISRSPRLVILDEARTYARADAQEMWSGIMGALNPPMQVIVISTGKAGTWYNDMTLDIDAGKMPGIRVTFLPDDIRPGHDMAWRQKRLAVLKGDVARMQREHPLVLKHLFSTSEGMVIGSWDKDVHVGSRPLEWKDGDEYFIVYDHGHTKSHPAVAIFVCYNRYEDFVYVFDEVFLRGKEVVEIGREIKLKHEHYMAQSPAPGRVTAIADTAIFNNHGLASVADVLIAESGLPFSNAFKHKKEHSLDLLQTRFFHQKILIDPVCVGGIKQLAGWVYQEGKDKAVEIEDDFGDCLRYLCAQIEKGERPPEQTVFQKSMKYIAELEGRAARTAEGGLEDTVNLDTAMAGEFDKGLC